MPQRLLKSGGRRKINVFFFDFLFSPLHRNEKIHFINENVERLGLNLLKRLLSASLSIPWACTRIVDKIKYLFSSEVLFSFKLGIRKV